MSGKPVPLCLSLVMQKEFKKGFYDRHLKFKPLNKIFTIKLN